MKTMSEENKENPSVKNRQPISDLLMKPFSLGWTREVVRRVVTHCGTPNCDIYYFNPNKKKLRSLTEVKSNLTDGLSAECFSFKREPLGLSPDLETVRDAKARGKGAGADKSKEKRKASESSKKLQNSTETPEEEDANETGKKVKRKKTETEDTEVESKTDGETIEEKPETNNSEEKAPEKESENFVTKPRRTKAEVKETVNSRDKAKTKGKPVRLSVKNRKSALKRVMSAKQAKQTKVVPSRKTLKGIRKKVAPPKRKLSKTQNDKKAASKSKKNSSKIKRAGGSMKSKSEGAKGMETNDTEKKKPTARDLRSIVKKNIGKYREMREKQKLGAVKGQGRSPSKKLAISHIPRSRSEPISKNKPFYLKPLEKGWRRELVFRANCAKAGQQADVYYFHPNGKKLRSCREIAENLTQGLSIECFTFRKEPIGCGEPSEVIRNARSTQKN